MQRVTVDDVLLKMQYEIWEISADETFDVSNISDCGLRLEEIVF